MRRFDQRHARPARGPAPAGLAALAGLLLLSACASPCERISDDMRRLNADMIRNPAIITDGSYAREFQELAAQSVENACFRE